MKPNKVSKFMTVAIAISKLSQCKRQVGCILLDHCGHIRATGYNGPPRNMGICSCLNRVSGEDLDLCPAVHAEQNAVMQCADVIDLEFCFSTTKPCRHCIKMLLNTGVQTIYYLEDYPHEGVTELWESAGRSIHKMECI